MIFLLAIVDGVLFGAGFYMILRRSIVKLIIGLALLAHAANLFIFMMGGIRRGRPPLVPEDPAVLSELVVADPLPQALILTAIVIGFGAQAFAIVLVRRVYQAVGTDDIDKLRATDVVEG